LLQHSRVRHLEFAISFSTCSFTRTAI
jgi:hypothetical protein